MLAGSSAALADPIPRTMTETAPVPNARFFVLPPKLRRPGRLAKQKQPPVGLRYSETAYNVWLRDCPSRFELYCGQNAPAAGARNEPQDGLKPLRNSSPPRAEKRWVSLTLYPSYELLRGHPRLAFVVWK
jgi:hypothetical protein